MMEKKRSSDNKTVALKYKPPYDQAPRVVAKGSGKLSEKIIELAKKNRIPIREDPALVEILTKLDLEEEIPPEVYPVVAEILAFIYSLHKKWGDNPAP